MYDPTENARRERVKEVNQPGFDVNGQRWTTEEMTEEFDVVGFLAPLVVVVRKSDGVKGTLEFTHRPRVYFGWRRE